MAAVLDMTGEVDSGAKFTATVAVPGPGRFCAVFEMYATSTGIVKVSVTLGSEYRISYVATAVVPLMVNGFGPMVQSPPISTAYPDGVTTPPMPIP